MIYCAEIYAGIDPEGTEDRVLIANIDFTVGGGGSPANTVAYNRLMQAANFERSMADGKLVLGRTETGYGECVVANADGELDYLTTYAVDGRDFYLWALESDTGVLVYEPFPLGWVRIFRCSMQSIVGDGDVLRVRLRERTFQLDQPLCPKFLGTGGLEGTADLEGQPKPLVFGGAYNVSPVLLSPSLLIYLVSASGFMAGHHLKDSGSVVARQLAATGYQENDSVASFADLQTTPVSIGHYATHATSGTLRLGSPAIGQVTVDAASTVSDNPSDVFKEILEAAGVATTGVYSQIDDGDFDDLYDWGVAEASRIGIYVRDDTTTAGQAISALAASIGAWFGVDRWGTLRTSIVVDPASMTSVLSLTEDDVQSVKRIGSGEPGKGVPYGRVVQKYPRNWTPQSSGLVGVVPPRVRGEIAEQFPLSVVTACAQLSSSPPATVPITDQFLKAPDYVIESYGVGRRVTSTGALEATVPAPGDQFAALFGVPRDWIEVVMPFRISDFETVDLGSCMTLTHSRFDLTEGKQFLVTRIRYDLSSKPTATLTLWG